MYLLVFVSLAFKFFVNAQPTHLVISQAYGAGGNSGAVYNRDFVELFNPTTKSVMVEIAGQPVPVMLVVE